MKKIWGISLSLILINLTSIMEKADENLLPSVYKEVSETFSASPSQLGYLTFIRNFVQALFSPLAGILVIHYDRPTVLSMGTFCWALSTAAVGMCQYFEQVAFWRAINGIGLAIVIPALQSFIADTYLEGVRGFGFGCLSLVGSGGGIGGSILATILAGYTFWGIAGWRCAFILMALLSSLIGLLVFVLVVDPRKMLPYSSRIKRHSKGDDVHKKDGVFSPSIWKDSWIAMRAVVKVKTFQIIVLQGIVGSLPWTAMVFFTMWFELIGFGHKDTAILMSLFAGGCAFGSLLGGWIADRVASIFPFSGRILCAQFSAFMGIPFSWFLLTVITQATENRFLFGSTLLFMGLTISWCQACANSPLFAEVVPTKHRTMIYAFDRAFEGSFSAFAAPIVGILAEKVYGYDVKSVIPGTGSTKEAYALSRGLFAMMAIPFGLCCLFYTPLHSVYKHDRDEVRSISLMEEELHLVTSS
uniref:Major facilitator superfamily (MFS) profile domain-containing protein n=1 Tax=Araucaria cunninghamii TaxID=56994 RepID=A0A0D6R8T3_ARACU